MEKAQDDRRIQRNFGIDVPVAEWLRGAAFVTGKSQSQLAREAFDLLQSRFEKEGITVPQVPRSSG